MTIDGELVDGQGVAWSRNQSGAPVTGWAPYTGPVFDIFRRFGVQGGGLEDGHENRDLFDGRHIYTLHGHGVRNTPNATRYILRRTPPVVRTVTPPRLRGRRVLRRVRLLRVVRRLGARSGPCAADVRCCSSDDGQPHRRSYGGGASVSAYRAGFCSDSQRRPTAALVALLPCDDDLPHVHGEPQQFRWYASLSAHQMLWFLDAASPLQRAL